MIKSIPLNKLVQSPRNVRRHSDPAADAELKASIAAHGLLQNLIVRPAAKGKFEVEAGERRRRAMLALADDQGLRLLEFTDRRGLERELVVLRQRLKCAILPGTNAVLTETQRQLTRYFSGESLEFDLELLPAAVHRALGLTARRPISRNLRSQAHVIEGVATADGSVRFRIYLAGTIDEVVERFRKRQAA